ncbi:MAG TPA: acyltransferase [Caldilineaceae bacterium]|nr:acyltransferase [Caldilineaceae bacterium]
MPPKLPPHREQIREAPKIYSLQTFRAGAAILVLLFHATLIAEERFGYEFLNKLFAFGYTGVDFFFVLSGFIILYTYMDKVGRESNVWPYLYKRLFRIYPLYWIITSIKVAVIFLLPSVAKEHEKGWEFIVQSYLLIPQKTLPMIGAAWTLSHEVLFYLLFALALLLPLRASLLLAGCWIVSTLAFYAGAVVGLSIPKTYITLFLLNERNIEFLLGCLGAYIIRTQRDVWTKYDLQITGLGLALLVATSTFLTLSGSVPSYLLFFGLPSFFLIVGSALLENRLGNHWPSLIILLGDASYSIYLTHAMFMNVFILAAIKAGLLESTDLFTTTTTMVAFAILCGLGVHFVFERPLLNHLRNRRVPSFKPSVESERAIQSHA